MAFGIYVHIPYCVKKCPYCDFNSYGVGKLIPEEDYTEALLKEVDFYEESIGELSISSLFFGGGTPSLFSLQSVERIIDKILSIAPSSERIEVSLEVNPKTADLGKLRGFREVGVNRISVGVQSFSERKLKVLGRVNSPEDSRKILEDVVKAGFDNFNLDLMYGVSDETLEEWKVDLLKALEFNSTHISAYNLTIEDDTEFAVLHAAGRLALPDEDTLADMIVFTSEFLEESGYRQYEISNYAKPGFECRHNLLYWRGESYIGLGAGAHSHLAQYERAPWGTRWANLKDPAAYINTLKDGKRPLAFTERLSRGEAIEDRVLMGLRLREGISLMNLEQNFGVELSSDKLDYLMDKNYIQMSDNCLRLTGKGFLLSNDIILKVLDSLIIA
jgi:oxygen-independent coproporphyrinogen-3 oxidase